MDIRHPWKRLFEYLEVLPDSFDVNSVMIFEFIRSGVTKETDSNIDTYESFTLNKIISDLKSIIYKTNLFSSENNLINLFRYNFLRGHHAINIYETFEIYTKYSDQIRSSFYWSIATLQNNEINYALIVEGIKINELSNISQMIIHMCKLISQLLTTNNHNLLSKQLFNYHQKLINSFKNWKKTEEGKNQLKKYSARKGKAKQQYNYSIKNIILNIDRIEKIILFIINNQSTDKREITMKVWQNEVKETKPPYFLNNLAAQRKLTSHRDYKNIMKWVEYIINVDRFKVDDINDIDEIKGLAVRTYYSYPENELNNEPFVYITLNGKHKKIML